MTQQLLFGKIRVAHDGGEAADRAFGKLMGNLGSTTDRVSEHCHCTVMIVK